MSASRSKAEAKLLRNNVNDKASLRSLCRGPDDSIGIGGNDRTRSPRPPFLAALVSVKVIDLEERGGTAVRLGWSSHRWQRIGVGDYEANRATAIAATGGGGLGGAFQSNYQDRRLGLLRPATELVTRNGS